MGMGFYKKNLEKETRKGNANHEHKSECFMHFYFFCASLSSRWGFLALRFSALSVKTLAFDYIAPSYMI